MLYLGAQMELEAHLGHVSMVFEPYKSIGVKKIDWGVTDSILGSASFFTSYYM